MTLSDQHSLSVRTKRKPSSTSISDVPRSKRQRVQSPVLSLASSDPYKPRPKQVSCHSTSSNTVPGFTSSARTSSCLTCFKLQLNDDKMKKTKSHTDEDLALFSRYADPSVHRLQPESTSVSENDRRGITEFEITSVQPHCREQTDMTGLPLMSKGETDGVVDLTVVEHVGSLEMVEGDDILQTLLRVSSPRAKRRFQSEKALTDSEQRDHDVLRRQRLKLRSQFSALQEKQPCDKQQVRHLDFEVCQQSLEAERSSGKPNECAQIGKIEGGTVGRVASKERAQLIEDDNETDEETTESKINRLSKVVHMNWRQLFVWLVAGAMLLCTLVVAAPFIKILIEPPLPYCDSEWVDVDEQYVVLATPVDKFDRSKALQPFVSTASVTTRASEPVCQPCPVYGNCLNGSVISCAPPYELQNGLCKESLEVQANLDQIALSIQIFVVETASKNACDNVSLWCYLNEDDEKQVTRNVTALLEVWLSDVESFVNDECLFGKAVSNLPRDYVFSRALDMALRDLKDISVTKDQRQLVVSRNLLPWSCRAKHQLYTHIKLIALAVALGTVLVFAYRQFFLCRTERQLVDRFVKEARFCLLDRTRRPDRFYPANHLRDDLFKKQSVQDRKWLCKSIWPKIVAVLKNDSRISMRAMRVRGGDIEVWEWASSASPTHRRAGATRGRAFHAVVKPQEGNTGDTESVSSRRRTKVSRLSLP